MRFFLGHFFDGDRTNARSGVDINQLFGGRIFSGNQHVAQQNRKRLVADQILCHQHRVPEPERLLLPRVTHLHHVADTPNHGRLFLLPSFFQEALEHGRMVEVIFDRILSLARHDDDVFDSRGNALFHDVLDLRFVHHRQHFFGLRFGGRQKTRAESRGRKHRLANFACGCGLPDELY